MAVGHTEVVIAWKSKWLSNELTEFPTIFYGLDTCPRDLKSVFARKNC